MTPIVFRRTHPNGPSFIIVPTTNGGRHVIDCRKPTMVSRMSNGGVLIQRGSTSVTVEETLTFAGQDLEFA